MAGQAISESGDISILALFMAVASATLIVLAVSLGSLYAQWSVISNTVDIARDSTCAAGFQMMVKESDNPGRLVAERLASELKRAGINGKLTIWFAESDDPSLGANVRAMAYSAKLSCPTYESTLLGEIDIPCFTSASIVPYGSTHTYDPGLRGTAQCFTFATLDADIEESDIDIANLPPKAKTALALAVKKASEYKTS